MDEEAGKNIFKINKQTAHRLKQKLQTGEDSRSLRLTLVL